MSECRGELELHSPLPYSDDGYARAAGDRAASCSPESGAVGVPCSSTRGARVACGRAGSLPPRHAAPPAHKPFGLGASLVAPSGRWVLQRGRPRCVWAGSGSRNAGAYVSIIDEPPGGVSASSADDGCNAGSSAEARGSGSFAAPTRASLDSSMASEGDEEENVAPAPALTAAYLGANFAQVMPRGSTASRGGRSSRAFSSRAASQRGTLLSRCGTTEFDFDFDFVPDEAMLPHASEAVGGARRMTMQRDSVMSVGPTSSLGKRTSVAGRFHEGIDKLIRMATDERLAKDSAIEEEEGTSPWDQAYRRNSGGRGGKGNPARGGNRFSQAVKRFGIGARLATLTSNTSPRIPFDPWRLAQHEKDGSDRASDEEEIEDIFEILKTLDGEKSSRSTSAASKQRPMPSASPSPSLLAATSSSGSRQRSPMLARTPPNRSRSPAVNASSAATRPSDVARGAAPSPAPHSAADTKRRSPTPLGSVHEEAEPGGSSPAATFGGKPSLAASEDTPSSPTSGTSFKRRSPRSHLRLRSWRHGRDLRCEVKKMKDNLLASAQQTFSPEVWGSCGIEADHIKKQKQFDLLATSFATALGRTTPQSEDAAAALADEASSRRRRKSVGRVSVMPPVENGEIPTGTSSRGVGGARNLGVGDQMGSSTSNSPSPAPPRAHVGRVILKANRR